MKTLLEINKELNRLNNIYHKLLFEIGFEKECHHTKEEVSEAIKNLSYVKNLFIDCDPTEAIDIIRVRRNSDIIEESGLSDYEKHAIGRIINISIECYNWVLERDQFDRTLYQWCEI